MMMNKFISYVHNYKNYMSRDAFHLLNGILYFFLPIRQVIFPGRKHPHPFRYRLSL